VNSPMRRTIFLALVAAVLVLAPSARAAGTTQIIRDCADDGVLQGNYTLTELRNARSHIPAELDEYSDCRDVLTRAIASAEPKANSSNSNSGGSTGTGGGTGTGSGSGGGGSSNSGGSPSSTPAPTATPDVGSRAPGSVPMLQQPQDWQAVATAAANGDKAVETGASPLSPGQSRLAADIGRNGIPGVFIIVLVLLAVATLAGMAAVVIRRGFAGSPS
jgi:hypothetical protein